MFTIHEDLAVRPKNQSQVRDEGSVLETHDRLVHLENLGAVPWGT